MELENVWDKKETWTLRSDTSFVVEVVHWYSKGRVNRNYNVDMDLLSHKWNVYVIVKKLHPMFTKLTEEDTCYSHYSLDDLHWGSTFCKWERDSEGRVLTRKYGSDYMHLDDDYEDCDGEDHWKAREIFGDAKRLFNTFIKLKEER